LELMAPLIVVTPDPVPVLVTVPVLTTAPTVIPPVLLAWKVTFWLAAGAPVPRRARRPGPGCLRCPRDLAGDQRRSSDNNQPVTSLASPPTG
jgi:hypothetical protein